MAYHTLGHTFTLAGGATVLTLTTFPPDKQEQQEGLLHKFIGPLVFVPKIEPPEGILTVGLVTMSFVPTAIGQGLATELSFRYEVPVQNGEGNPATFKMTYGGF